MFKLMPRLPMAILTSAFWVLVSVWPCPGSAGVETFRNPKKFTIVHTNDTHSHIAGPKPRKDGSANLGGAARRVALIRDLRATLPEVVYVDSGDIFQGTLFFNFFKGEVEFKLAAMAGLDLMTLGNHEFDAGQNILAERATAAPFPIVCANVSLGPAADPRLKKLIKPSFQRKIGDFTLTFVGLVTDELMQSTNPLNLEGVSVIEPARAFDAAMEGVPPGSDAVIVLSHLGIAGDLALASARPSISAIIGGHTHTALHKGIQVRRVSPSSEDFFSDNGSDRESDNGILIVQSGSFGRYLGRIDLEISGPVGKPRLNVLDTGLIPIEASLKEDPEALVLIDGYTSEFKGLVGKKVGETKDFLDAERANVRLRETNLGNLIADILRKFGNTDVAIVNGGCLRASIPGPVITIEDIMTCLPFSDKVVRLHLKGSEIVKLFRIVAQAPRDGHYGGFLQVSGMKVIYGPGEVSEISIGGRPVDPDRSYSITTNEFLTLGGDGLTVLMECPYIQRTGALLSDLVIDYVRGNSPVSAKCDGRIRFEDR